MSRYSHPCTFGVIAFALLALPGAAFSQMLDPSIDRNDEPFCYYSTPTDVVGVMDGPQGTLVSPEGYLYTGYGELMFFTGNPPEPIHQRVKTLLKGYLPVVQYSFTRSGIRYEFSVFAATLDGKPESPLMNFIRVTIRNTARKQQTAFFSVATRYENEENSPWGVGDNRFGRPAEAKVPGHYEQSGVPFSPEWIYGFDDDAMLRDNKVMYFFPREGIYQRMLTLKTGYNEPYDLKATKLEIQRTTPVGIVMYSFRLEPGKDHVLDFKMPYEPVPPGDTLVGQLRNAGYDQYLNSTVEFWESIFSRGIDIAVPEDKVVDAFKANLVYDLIARNKEYGFFIQKVNDFQYHAFWLRDASYIVRMYDLSGYHDIARQCLEFFPRWQQPDGNYLSQGGQYDGWGQTMWAFGQHYRITHDRQFAEWIYPSLQKAVAWLHQARLNDPYDLMPASTPGDNEDISGHVTGHNFWALAGLKNVIAVAKALGKEDDVRDYQREYDDYFAALGKRLKEVTAATGGYIPPGLDSLGGQDWGNMLSVYPEEILDPFDPMVSATLKATRAKYLEGIMTYGDGRWLHHYLTMKNTETEIIRGDQETAIEELYAILLHTSATHAGFEFSILPWSTRDFGMNLSPHGWFAAKFRAMVRDMMVRVQDGKLHLFSCISPEWVRDGKSVTVKRAPTRFGTVNAEMVFRPGGARVTLDNAFVEAPDAIVLHLPWFMDVSSVSADGKQVGIDRGVATLPANAHAVEIRWKKKGGAPALSYDAAVRDYKREYRRRYEEYLSTGTSK